MKKLFKFIIISVLIVGLGLYIYITRNRLSVSTPSENLSISTKSYNKDIYFQVPVGDPSAIKTIKVTKDEPKLLELSVIFTYDGAEGTEVSTCGGVIKQDLGYSKEWGCRPTRLNIGENTVLYRFKLLDDQPADYYCTDTVRVNIYKHGGGDFFNQLFKYEKTWINGNGFYAQFKQFAYSYIKCS